MKNFRLLCTIAFFVVISIRAAAAPPEENITYADTAAYIKDGEKTLRVGEES
jgi:hypothetical protein